MSGSLSQEVQPRKLTEEQKPLPASPGTARPPPPPPPRISSGLRNPTTRRPVSCCVTQLDPHHSGSSSAGETCADHHCRNTTRAFPSLRAPRSLPPQGLCSYCPSGTFSYTLPLYNAEKHPHALDCPHPRRRGCSHEESLHEDLPLGCPLNANAQRPPNAQRGGWAGHFSHHALITRTLLYTEQNAPLLRVTNSPLTSQTLTVHLRATFRSCHCPLGST